MLFEPFLSFLRIDPPGPGRIGGHYFHICCPSVRLSVSHIKHAIALKQNMLQRYMGTIAQVFTYFLYAWDLVGHFFSFLINFMGFSRYAKNISFLSHFLPASSARFCITEKDELEKRKHLKLGC